MKRIPHDAEYISRLGAAVYAFAYTEWLVFELVTLADPTISLHDVAALRTGEVAPALRRGLAALALEPELAAVPDRWAALVRARHDVIHAHPATDPVAGQRLYGWVPGRAGAVFVSDERLVAFTADVEGLLSDANRLRDVLHELRG